MKAVRDPLLRARERRCNRSERNVINFRNPPVSESGSARNIRHFLSIAFKARTTAESLFSVCRDITISSGLLVVRRTVELSRSRRNSRCRHFRGRLRVTCHSQHSMLSSSPRLRRCAQSARNASCTISSLSRSESPMDCAYRRKCSSSSECISNNVASTRPCKLRHMNRSWCTREAVHCDMAMHARKVP